MIRLKINKTGKLQTRKNSSKRIIYLLLILGLATVPLVLFNRWASQPSNQSIIVGGGTGGGKPVPKFQTLKTGYFSVKVLSDWRIRNELDHAASSRLHILVYAPSGNSQAAITSDLLPPDGLNGVADYHLRATDVSTYAEVKEPSYDFVTKAFKTRTSIGETVFMVRNGRYASLTLSGQETPKQLSSLLNIMLNSWQWTP